MRDPRIEQHWKKLSLDRIEEIGSKDAIVILSYSDDEGVRINRGRPGAAEGPARILYFLGRYVHRLHDTPEIFILERFHDKNTDTQLPPLKDRHASAERSVLNLLKEGFRVITLGGGHDYGYPDSSAFYQYSSGKILNIDAHLDVRPVVNEEFNSGTPFYRFIERFGGKPLVEWGIQPQCNAVSHLEFAEKAGALVLSYREKLPKISGPVGLSVCLDAFAGIRGVSAPAIVGLSPEDGVEAIRSYAKASRWLGLYECAPAHDPLTEDSARLGALLAYHFIHETLKI